MQFSTNDHLGPALALFHAPGLSPRLFHKLFSHYKSYLAILKADGKELNRFGLPRETIALLKAYLRRPGTGSLSKSVHQSLFWSQLENQTIVVWTDAHYPEQLREIPASPPVLFVKGDATKLTQRQIAFVGSRKASHSGLNIAAQFSGEVVRAGWHVTSGLALGIDGAAHQGALDSGGATIAVMATGADQVYPRRHQGLAKKIIENGALVSEFPLGTVPHPSLFPQRNRIISGLCRGVLVVEAAEKSGSLITARYAVQQNREVFAVPGPIQSRGTKGCHALIKQGAKLVESVTDIFEELCALGDVPVSLCDTSDSVVGAKQKFITHQEKLESLVFSCVDFTPCSVDQLLNRTKIFIEELAPVLMALELQEKILPYGEGYIRSGSTTNT